MKKIIFNINSLIMGGQEKIAIEYLKLLSDLKKYEILLLIDEDNGEKGNYFLKDIPKDIKYKFIINQTLMNKVNKCRELRRNNLLYKILYNYYLCKRKKERKKIKNILKNEKYDYFIDFTGELPIEVTDERVFSWSHLSLKNIKKKKLPEALEKIKRVNKFIVLTDEMKEEGIELFPECKDKFIRIYNFFDIEKIKKDSIDNSVLTEREKELLKEEYFFACCRLDKQKDIDTLIEAYRILKDKYKIKEKLYIAGEGVEEKRLNLLVKKYGLENDILFLGLQRNPYIWMKNSRIFLHSSFREGLPTVIIEALITNGLVISSDCPTGPREILENGKSGLLFPVGNEEKLVEEILKVLNNEEIIKKYKMEAKRRIKDFSKEKIKEDILKLLN